MTFDRTAAASAPDPAPEVVAALCNLAISLLRLAGSHNIAHATRHTSRDVTRAAKLVLTSSERTLTEPWMARVCASVTLRRASRRSRAGHSSVAWRRRRARFTGSWTRGSAAAPSNTAGPGHRASSAVFEQVVAQRLTQAEGCAQSSTPPRGPRPDPKCLGPRSCCLVSTPAPLVARTRGRRVVAGPAWRCSPSGGHAGHLNDVPCELR